MWWIGVVVLLIAVQAGAQTVFYWVGGSGTFADAAHWSASSGGTGGVGVPGSSDQAKIDLLSGTGTMTLDPGLVGTHITLGTFHITPNSTITIDPGHSLVETTGYPISAGFWDGFGWWDVDGITPFYDVQIDARGADVVQIFDGGVMHTLTLMPGINVQFESYPSNSIPVVTADSVVCAGTGGSPITISQWSPGTVRWAVAQQVVCTTTTVDHNACISTVPCVGTTDAGNNTGWQFIGDTTPVPPTWTPTVTPTTTPTSTPTLNATPGCGAMSMSNAPTPNPVAPGLTCLDAAVETGVGFDCTAQIPSLAQGGQGCCELLAQQNSYCDQDTGTTGCVTDSDCAGGTTGPCDIMTCTFTAGGACQPPTFPEGGFGGACVAGATETPTATPTVTPTATGPTPTPGITPGCCALVGAPAPTTCLDNAWFAGHPELGVSTVASLSDCQAQSVILYAGQDFVTAYNAVNCVNGTAPDHTDGRCGAAPRKHGFSGGAVINVQ